MYMYIHVCMYIYMQLYIHVHVYMYTCVYMQLFIYITTAVQGSLVLIFWPHHVHVHVVIHIHACLGFAATLLEVTQRAHTCPVSSTLFYIDFTTYLWFIRRTIASMGAYTSGNKFSHTWGYLVTSNKYTCTCTCMCCTYMYTTDQDIMYMCIYMYMYVYMYNVEYSYTCNSYVAWGRKVHEEWDANSQTVVP